MRFCGFSKQFEKYGVITTAMMKTVFGEKWAYIARLISERTRKKLLVQLRRGVYTFNNIYLLEKIHPLYFANKILEPSYVSTYSALEYYGLIPEKVQKFTSVTTNKTNLFENDLGAFFYQKVKQELFRGYESRKFGENNVLIALPEKALLDLIYLSKEQENFIEYFRLQHVDILNKKILEDFGKKFKNVKVDRFLAYFLQYDDGYSSL